MGRRREAARQQAWEHIPTASWALANPEALSSQHSSSGKSTPTPLLQTPQVGRGQSHSFGLPLIQGGELEESSRKIRNGLFTEVNPPSSSRSESNPVLLPPRWCSLQPTCFPFPVQQKDAGNHTGLIPLPSYHKGYRHRVGDPQHSPENGLSLAQYIPGGAIGGEILPMKKLQGMRDPVPTKPALASNQGCAGQALGASHLPLALGCHLMPPPQLAHPETGSVSSSTPGLRDAGWRQH